MNKEGIIIWEIQKNGVPKEIHRSDNLGRITEHLNFIMRQLDIGDKTYAIRIGKEGLK